MRRVYVFFLIRQRPPRSTRPDTLFPYTSLFRSYGSPCARYAAIAPHISSGVCKPTGVRKQACAAHRDYGWPWPDNKYCDDDYATEYECTADLPVALSVSPLTGASWHADRKSTRLNSSH